MERRYAKKTSPSRARSTVKHSSTYAIGRFGRREQTRPIELTAIPPRQVPTKEGRSTTAVPRDERRVRASETSNQHLMGKKKHNKRWRKEACCNGILRRCTHPLVELAHVQSVARPLLAQHGTEHTHTHTDGPGRAGGKGDISHALRGGMMLRIAHGECPSRPSLVSQNRDTPSAKPKGGRENHARLAVQHSRASNKTGHRRPLDFVSAPVSRRTTAAQNVRYVLFRGTTENLDMCVNPRPQVD